MLGMIIVIIIDVPFYVTAESWRRSLTCQRVSITSSIRQLLVTVPPALAISFVRIIRIWGLLGTLSHSCECLSWRGFCVLLLVVAACFSLCDHTFAASFPLLKSKESKPDK